MLPATSLRNLTARRYCRRLVGGRQSSLLKTYRLKQYAEPESKVDRDLIQENIENAAKVLNDIIEEVGRNMFVSEATAFVTSENPDMSQQEAIRNAVVQRIEFLDANFLAALGAYIQVAQTNKEDVLADVLVTMREEVLRQVALRLPPAAQVLDLALKETDKDARVQIVKTALEGGKDSVPGADMDSLWATTCQFVDDMEEQEIIADRKLLARLCLVKEELRWIDLEQNFMQQSDVVLFSRANVPQSCIAFLKEIVRVSADDQRIGLLTKAFKEDWDYGSGSKPASQDVSEYGSSNALTRDTVRPGKFLSTLHSAKTRLKQDEEANALLLRKIDLIQYESVSILDKMQRSSK